MNMLKIVRLLLILIGVVALVRSDVFFYGVNYAYFQ